MTSRLAKPAIDVGIVSADAGPLLDFYQAAFGFERLEPVEIPGVGTVHKLAAGHSVLRIMVPAQPPRTSSEADFSAMEGIRYLTIEVEDIQSVVAAVVDAGGSIALAPFELRPGRFISQIADPDGNMIELGQG